MGHLTPAGQYRIAALLGDCVVTAGITPRVDGVLVRTGRIGAEVSPDDARGLAATAVARALDAAASALDGDARLAGVAAMTVYLAVAPGFTDLSAVADGASAVLLDRFPDAPLPVRTTVGVFALPDGAPVEVQLTCLTASR